MDPHAKYERRLTVWLGITYVVIGLMSAALVVWTALGIGWRPVWQKPGNPKRKEPERP